MNETKSNNIRKTQVLSESCKIMATYPYIKNNETTAGKFL